MEYKGEAIQGDNFREITEVLLRNYDTEKEFLNLEILTPLLESIALEKLYLFYSATPEGERNNQDTLFEAEILKRLIFEKYNLETVLYPLKCTVVDANGLMRRYRSYIKKIVAENPKTEIVLCDAGGTAYQKSSLKIMLDFIVPANSLRIINVIDTKSAEGSVLKEEEPVEYRKIITEEQISSLVANGNYEGAAEILGSDTKDTVRKMVQLAFLLINNNYDEAFKEKNKFGKSIDNFEAFKGLFQNKNPLTNNFLSEQHYNRLYVILSVAQFYKKIKKFSFSVLFYSIFIENLLDYAFQKETGLELQSDWDKIKFKISKNEISIDQTPYVDFTRNSPSLPVKIQLCVPFASGIFKETLNLIKSKNSFYLPKGQVGLDSRRNKLAHEGRQVLGSQVKQYEHLFEFLNKNYLHNAENLFLRLNDDIRKAM